MPGQTSHKSLHCIIITILTEQQKKASAGNSRALLNSTIQSVSTAVKGVLAE